MGETLTVTVRSVNGQHAEVAVAGEVDVSTEAILREALVGLVERGAKDLVVDLADVTFLDSSGLRALIEVIRLGGKLTLRHLRPAVRLVFNIVTIPSLTIEN
ncbi:MAG: STAS domain-containing protein [Actinobacteria bacterium]|nr:STAS domain-containing protein [Actinomycetota bacterium]